MPKIEYKNINVCHIKYENDKDLMSFIDKNLSFATTNTLVFDYLGDDLINKLNSRKIMYILSDNVKFSTRSSFKYEDINHINNNIKSTTDDKQKESKKNETRILHRVIRSGEYIESSGDIIIFNRVNSTAKIKSDGNIFIYGRCDGDIECNGEYILLSQITNGKIIFNSEIINADMLKYRLNLISKKGNKLIIQDIDALIA